MPSIPVVEKGKELQEGAEGIPIRATFETLMEMEKELADVERCNIEFAIMKE
jgi:hypothetical protein